MKTDQVTVTAEDIAHGKRGDCLECPVTLAVLRWGEGAIRFVKVDGWHIIVAATGARHIPEYADRLDFTTHAALTPGWAVFHTPKEVDQFLSGFDLGGIGEPFTFALPCISDWLAKQTASLTP